MGESFLVIVESPAKCKTISKFLGSKYKLVASYGHVRDLPSKKLGVDIENNFEPSYTNMKEKAKVIKEIGSAIKKSDLVYIATDPDREGEAIAWHIANAIKIPKKKIRRIVFNEITETAIKSAIDSSRDIDSDLVNAQQARRILDRLIGYKLSPLLSKKIQRGLSAGRVQSVAVKIICDREKEILAFKPREFWVITADLHQQENVASSFTAKLVAKDTLKQKYEASNEKDAMAVKESLENSTFTIDDIVKSRVKRNPELPFITSTLQQEAARKLNWTAKKTMRNAQQLYEGIELNGEATGLISYIRTDSTRISDDAAKAAAAYIKEHYSTKYLNQKSSAKKSKKNIQDAHEAIRPVYFNHTPKSLENVLTSDLLKLYTLIWNRFISSQMTPAEYDRTQVVVKASHDSNAYFLRAAGSILVFDGFTRVYTEGTDENKSDDTKDSKLPPLEKNEVVKRKDISADQKFTQPPPRYTEASLVKTLEELGIGRPSTYAPTLSTIQDRGYVEKDQKKFFPSELGMVTNEKLEEYFQTILDLKFTANMEVQLDEIQEGKHEWNAVVSNYYTPLIDMIQHAYTNMEKISLGERNLGVDPKSGKDVIVKIGRYGPMAQIGSVDDEDKPQFAGVDGDLDIKTITLEQALKLFDFPKTVGQYEGKDVIINKGKYGPYVKFDSGFASIPKDTPLDSVSLDDAISFILAKREADKNKTIHDFSDHDPPIKVLNGPYGPYISSKKRNYKIPSSYDPKTLTPEDCVTIIKTPKKKRS